MITVVEPRFFWPETTLKMFPFLMEHIEICGRVCYRSEDKITDGSAERFVKMINKSGHHSVLEHFSITAIVVCSRACSHQLVRHRISSFSQESMRYCNYGKDDSLQVICPPSIGLEPGDYVFENDGLWRNGILYIPPFSPGKLTRWVSQIDSAYQEYKAELKNGVKPEDARYVLPNATKTKLAVTFNVRSWLHFFKMRCDKHAQWEIRGIANSILNDLSRRFPSVFIDSSVPGS